MWGIGTPEDLNTYLMRNKWFKYRTVET
jgi:hypothetical protein